MNKQKYILRNDDEGHWYLIKKEDAAKFEKICYGPDESWDIEEAAEWLEHYCIDGPHKIVFTEFEIE